MAKLSDTAANSPAYYQQADISEARAASSAAKNKGAAKRATPKRTPRWQLDALDHMAHELRTPLNVILGFAQLLLDPTTSGNLTAEQCHQIDRITEAGHYLEGVIASMLEVSSLDAGQVHLHYSEVAPGELLRAVCDQLEALAQAKDLRLHLALAPDPPPLRLDRQRMQQVLFNLIGNAIKFAPPGSVVEVGAQPGPERTMDFFVRDAGPGIPKRYHKAIFKPFMQATPDVTLRKQGQGLGLAITRQLVTLHGGTIWVESAPRRGSTFWVRLPVSERS
jgi:signal transduction histidine kinase